MVPELFYTQIKVGQGRSVGIIAGSRAFFGWLMNPDNPITFAANSVDEALNESLWGRSPNLLESI